MKYYDELSSRLNKYLGGNIDDIVEYLFYNMSIDKGRFILYSDRHMCNLITITGNRSEAGICGEFESCSACPFFTKDARDFLRGCFSSFSEASVGVVGEPKNKGVNLLFNYFIHGVKNLVVGVLMHLSDKILEDQLEEMKKDTEKYGLSTILVTIGIRNKIDEERAEYLRDIRKKSWVIFLENMDAIINNLLELHF